MNSEQKRGRGGSNQSNMTCAIRATAPTEEWYIFGKGLHCGDI